ncbi:MAG: YqgE/AlgH family protein [Acidimicrobiia bacterium]
MSLVGNLLIATPVMGDPNFVDTVVLVCAHDEAGAVGVVLDRPTGIAVEDHLPDWSANAADPAMVFLGGPVQVEVAIVVAEGDATVSGWTPVVGTAGLIDLEGSDPDSIGRVRVFAGYSGWGAGQLESEIASLDWIVVPAHPDDAFAADPSGIRARALHRKGGLYPAYLQYPDDPALN